MSESEETFERSTRVSSLELFFDLVFVFTITQLTSVLVVGGDATAVAQVVVMLAVIWWMYDGYAWLTNAITTDRIRYRIALIGGMGGFLVIALAIPAAFESDGLALGLAYLAVVLLHTGMYMRGASVAEARAMLRLGAYNITAAVLLVVGGALGGGVQWALWICADLVWLTPWITRLEAFVISTSHFVERHGLVVIIALGESVVVIGVGAAGLDLDAGLVVVALLSLALSATLWWLYFSDESRVEEALLAAPPERRPYLAVEGFGLWHLGLLLGVVAVAAGLKKAIGAPYDPLDGWIALELAGGVALFAACDVGFRWTLDIRRSGVRLAASALALATTPLGTELSASAEIGMLAAIVVAALALEARRAVDLVQPGR
jgi:low temperature requirement protein LtrA